jgi:hypothetical protein
MSSSLHSSGAPSNISKQRNPVTGSGVKIKFDILDYFGAAEIKYCLSERKVGGS